MISRDRKGTFRFVSLQSPAGKKILERLGLSSAPITTLVLVEGDRSYTRSTGALKILSSLGGVWWLAAAVLMIIPPPLRDAVYDLIARHRYLWFGTRRECRVPGAEERDRFLD